ncbi:adenosine deaminase [Kluyvera cryocrescens]|uniref:adenosine deaminase n=1 Tax=Kluyvera cryocrescens TaxID=580 RepID=A0A485AKW7_KLUCR|nr:adenosine deaminase [Kluyvera cryocrescens]
MDYLAEKRIGIESCLTSNIQTSTVPSLALHPLKIFLEHGVLASLNTDDPAVQGIDIQHEYHVAGAGCRLEPAADPPGADQRPGDGLPERFREAGVKGSRPARIKKNPGSACLPGFHLFRSSDQIQRRAMLRRFNSQLNQFHNLNRLACRHGVFTHTI